MMSVTISNVDGNIASDRHLTSMDVVAAHLIPGALFPMLRRARVAAPCHNSLLMSHHRSSIPLLTA
jgi:hypothetical protein